ncbi:hypothetical protein A0J61_05554 [Choanephora cucurbitarum]|uniref:Uncharacterized protein n=1 Tax=Choanephora cucurbitarum TaxID=101091 RepID=A0A1C7NCV6_9FUNG|nr:hypothetical protein A0J61_05554 [Choanephora cucurbitarum]
MSSTICGPGDPVLLYVHCTSHKPDPHVKIRRQTTPSGIPPVIIVTGTKQEGKLPEISDERPDRSVKIIVLDLRDEHQATLVENQPASKFKKMPKEMWDNVLSIRMAFRPNQPTECPIQTSPTIDVYTNILPKSTMVPPNNNVNMYPNVMLPPPPPLPQTYMNPQQNYLMAAAQSIMNAAVNYNMYPYMMQAPPPPPPAMNRMQAASPMLQYNNNSNIKRKPVQLQSPQPTPYLSPQLEQRIQRKKTSNQKQPPLLPRQPYQQQQQQQHMYPSTAKKRVRFDESLQIFEYQPESSEDEEVEGSIDMHDYIQPHPDDYYYTQDYASYSPYSPPEPIRRSNGRRPTYYYPPEPIQEDEDWGDLWKRRDFIARHSSTSRKSSQL